MADTENTLNFEDAFSRLERTVQSLETGGLTLEDALTRYQEGMELARRCSELLDGAELTITRLTLTGETARPDQPSGV